MKISNVKKAVGDYKRTNKGHGKYGILMLDRMSGKLWVDDFCDFSHSSYIEYDCPAVINVIEWAKKRWPEADLKVSMTNVRLWAATACAEWC